MKLFLTLLMVCGLAHAKNIELTTDNHVLLRNEINDTSISKLQVELAQKVIKRGTKSYTIYLVLDSPGGSIDSGLNFIEFAKTIPNLETVSLFAASMASAIVEALPGQRNVLETGILMFHRARGGVSGQFEDGELESRLNAYKKMVRDMETVNAKRLGISIDVYKSKVKDELWVTGKDAVSAKAADATVSITCAADVINRTTIETFEFMGMQFDVKFNACALVKAGSVVQPENMLKYQQFKAEQLNMRSSK